MITLLIAEITNRNDVKVFVKGKCSTKHSYKYHKYTAELIVLQLHSTAELMDTYDANTI